MTRISGSDSSSDVSTVRTVAESSTISTRISVRSFIPFSDISLRECSGILPAGDGLLDGTEPSVELRGEGFTSIERGRARGRGKLAAVLRHGDDPHHRGTALHRVGGLIGGLSVGTADRLVKCTQAARHVLQECFEYSCRE